MSSRAHDLDRNYAPAHHWYSKYLAVQGHKEEALAEAETAYELAAIVFAGLGDKENALNWLDKAQEAHVSDLIGLGEDPHFVVLRDEHRFQALVKQVGLPE